MKIINQQGKTVEVYDIEMCGCKLYGQPLSLKKPQVLLGKYDLAKRTIEVMSEAVSLNSKDKKLVYKMPLK